MVSTRTLFAAGLALIAVITLSAVVVVQQLELQRVSSQLIIPPVGGPVYATQTIIQTVTTIAQGRIVNCVSFLLVGDAQNVAAPGYSRTWEVDFNVPGSGTFEVSIGGLNRAITATVMSDSTGSFQWVIPAIEEGQSPYAFSQHLSLPFTGPTGHGNMVWFWLQGGPAGVICLNISWVPDA